MLLGSVIAEIIMQQIENCIIPVSPPPPMQTLYSVDGILIEWPHDKQALNNFKEKLNQPYDLIKFIIEKENNSTMVYLALS